MGPSTNNQNAAASRKHLALAVFAGLRSVGTVVTAVLTWLTIWHFSETPFPLFYGWTFALVFLTLGSAKAVACSAPTTQIILALWRWGGPHHTSDHATVQGVPVAAAPLGANQLPQHIQLRGTQAALRPAVRLLKFVVATTSLMALFAACMVVHGGAVLADWHLARCYLAMASAPTQQARDRLTRAQQSAQECSVALALMFVAPAVAIKWALVMFLGDFSLIPVLSTITSSISYAYVITTFSASTFIYGRVWTFRQRALGVAAAVAAVMGQFLWRLASRSFLVLKFGGEVYFFYTIITHLLIGISVVARSRKGRHEYRDLFAVNRIQVFLLTLHGSALACDVPTLFHGLKSRQVASRPDWLRQLLFTPTSTGTLAWRILEGILVFIVVLTVFPMAPCSNTVAPEAGWYQVCAPEITQKWYVWRPKCWGCSMFDRYFVLGDVHERQAIVIGMLLPAVVLLLVTVCGLFGMRKLLQGCLGDALVDVSVSDGTSGDVRKDSSFGRPPAEKVPRHQLIESEYEHGLNGSDVMYSKDANPSAYGAVSGPASVSTAVVCPPVAGSVGAPLCVQSFNTSKPKSVAVGSPNSAHSGGVATGTAILPCASPAGPTAYGNGSDVVVSIHGQKDTASHKGGKHAVAGRGRNVVLKECELLESVTESRVAGQCSTSSSARPNSATLLLGASTKPPAASPDPDAAFADDHVDESPTGRSLLLRALALMWLVVVCDLVVFNCHWLLQLCMLVIGVLYTSWVHVAILFERDHKRRQLK